MNYQGKTNLNEWVSSVKGRLKAVEDQVINVKRVEQISALVASIDELLDASGLRDEVLARLVAKKPKSDDKLELAFLEAIAGGAFKAGSITRIVADKTGIDLDISNNYLKIRVALEAKGLIQKFGEKSATVYTLTDAGKARLKG